MPDHLMAARNALKQLKIYKAKVWLDELAGFVSKGQVSLERLGISQSEYDGFKHMVDVHEARTRLDITLRNLGRIFYDELCEKYIKPGLVSLEELDISQEAFDSLEHEITLSEARMIHRSLLSMKAQPWLNDLRRYVESGRVSLEDLGITQQEYDGYQKMVDAHRATQTA